MIHIEHREGYVKPKATPCPAGVTVQAQMEIRKNYSL